MHPALCEVAYRTHRYPLVLLYDSTDFRPQASQCHTARKGESWPSHPDLSVDVQNVTFLSSSFYDPSFKDAEN